MAKPELWQRFKKYLLVDERTGISIDVSRIKFNDGFFKEREADLKRAFKAMDQLEKGAIANPDENRMVGHYWLRDSSKAPNAEIRKAIDSCLKDIKAFVASVHGGKLKPQNGSRFTNILIVGIGGSALGPQFVSRALGRADEDLMTPYFFDNTDPDGMDAVLAQLGEALDETLCIVISKSGGTKETRNGMLEAKKAYEGAGLTFAKHAVAVTQEGSELDKLAVSEGWIKRFPMWDWVGGRTSVMSAVGLLPAALQGLDIQGMLAGAKAMDESTRSKNTLQNPAALLAAMWWYAGKGRGTKDMVLLPYKDRLELFSKYLQQLVMESLGKEKDLDGKVVNQGLAVYGNKGSTDQHAYVQQLRDGLNNFFVTFIEVLKDREGTSLAVEPGATSGDYLAGFYQGTRKALYESGRESITITVPEVSPETVGKLIALYERAVGFYATMVNINAYHQPGVEAGKKAATAVLALQKKIVDHLRGHKKPHTVEEIAEHVEAADEIETVFKTLQHLVANPDHGIKVKPGKTVFDAAYVAK